MPGTQANSNLSKRSFRPVRLELGFSATQFAYIVFSHLLATIAVIQLVEDYLWLALLLPVIAVHAVWLYKKYVSRQHQSSIKNLLWLRPDKWQLQYASGDDVTLHSYQATYISGWLIILRLSAIQGRVHDTVFITADAVDKRTFHELYVRLLVSKAG